MPHGRRYSAAHLQTAVQPGELVLADDIYGDFSEQYTDAEHRLFTVHRRGSPVEVRILRISVCRIVNSGTRCTYRSVNLADLGAATQAAQA